MLGLVFRQMAIFLLFSVVGYCLVRFGLLDETAKTTLSRLETYLFLPSSILSSFLSRCSWELLRSGLQESVYCLLGVLASLLVAAVYSRFSRRDGYEKQVIRYSLVIANYGFLGIALVRGIFGEEMLIRYFLFYLPLSIIGQSYVVSWLFPGTAGGFSVRKAINPITASLLIGVIGGISPIPKPSFLLDVLSLLANCMSPVAMLTVGVILGSYSIGGLLKSRCGLAVSVYRLFLFPSLLFAVFRMIGAPEIVFPLSLCCFATPAGLNVILIPMAHQKIQREGVSIVLLTHLFSVITLPLMAAWWLS